MAASRLSADVRVLCLAAIVALMIASSQSASTGERDWRRRKQLGSEEDHQEFKMSAEKQLLYDLMQRYRRIGKAGRPVKNATLTVPVDFGLGLINVDVTEKDNILSINAWTRYKWKDEYLMWEPRQYGDITSIRLNTDRIWMPDIMLYNTASTETHVRKVLAAVKHDGTVTWYPHCTFHSTCAVDVQQYPFDNQTCHLWFGSWTHLASEIDLNLSFKEGIDLSTWQADFKVTSKWDVEKVEANKVIETGYAALTFTLHLKRRPTFTSYILTIPVVLLSLLTLMVFWLPAEGADKASLGLAIFASSLLLLLILVEAAPSTASAVPLLGIYYCFNLVLVLASIFMSTWICTLGRPTAGKQQKPVPSSVFKLMTTLSPLLCLARPRGRHPASVESQLDSAEHRQMLTDTDFPLPSATSINVFPPPKRQRRALPPGPSVDCAALLTEILGVLKRGGTGTGTGSDGGRVAKDEWLALAGFIDRVLLVVFVGAVILSLILTFPRYE